MTGRRSKAYRRTAEEIIPMAWTDPWEPTHRDLEALWIEVAHGLGYRVACYRDSRGEHWGADSGWPDLFLVRNGRAWAIELKVPPDDLSEEQGIWLGLLDAVPGITAGVFRSSGDRAKDMAVIADSLATPPPVLPRVPS